MKPLITDLRKLIIIGSIIAITIIIYVIANIVLRRYFRKLLKKTNHDITGFLFFKHIVSGLIITIGAAFALEQIPEFRVIGLEDSSVKLRVWAWAANASNGFTLYCDLLQSIKKRFDAENIEIPFPKRSVIIDKS